MRAETGGYTAGVVTALHNAIPKVLNTAICRINFLGMVKHGQRLAEQGSIICAEGYVFELEKRGYLQAGAFVPECILEHPEVVKQLHGTAAAQVPNCEVGVYGGYTGHMASTLVLTKDR